jgi:transcription termination/antitermination protein NusG
VEATVEPAAEMSSTFLPALPIGYRELRWYATYTRAHHEKRVADQLRQRSVEHFLPLYETVHRWKDRRVPVKLPLFPGYVFVHLELKDRLKVLQIPSVVRLVGFNGHPTALSEGEIEALRDGLVRRLSAEPHPYLTVGRRVRIKSGPLKGLEGILVRRKRRSRIVLSMGLIMRSIIVDIDATDLEPI